MRVTVAGCDHVVVSDGVLVRGLPDGGHEFVLEHPVLSRLSIDGRVTFVFGPTEVTVSGPFTLEVDGVGHLLDPRCTESLAPVLATYPGTARWLWASSDGVLHLTLMQGQHLVVAAPLEGPAWTVGGSTFGARPPR